MSNKKTWTVIVLLTVLSLIVPMSAWAGSYGHPGGHGYYGHRGYHGYGHHYGYHSGYRYHGYYGHQSYYGFSACPACTPTNPIEIASCTNPEVRSFWLSVFTSRSGSEEG